MSGVKKNSSDIDKWLKRPEVKSNDVNKSDNNNDDVEDDKNKWLLVTSAAVATSSMDVDSDGDDVDNDDDELTQWLLIGRSPSRKEPVKSDIASVSSKGSIEAWLMSATADREPSIVVIDEDFNTDSEFDADFDTESDRLLSNFD